MKILTGLVTAVRIEDVARQSGKPVEIVYTGLREVDVRREHPLISHVPASSPRPLPVAFVAQRLSPGPVGVSGTTSQMVEE